MVISRTLFRRHNMKRIFYRLGSWWFATMVPIYGSLRTIDERETLRKRRLLSILLLLSFLQELPFLPLSFFDGSPVDQRIQSALACGCMVLALWINRRGYLKCASLFYLLIMFVG